MGTHRKNKKRTRRETTVAEDDRHPGGEGADSNRSSSEVCSSGADEEGAGGDDGYTPPDLGAITWTPRKSEQFTGGVECPDPTTNDATTADSQSKSTNMSENVDGIHHDQTEPALETGRTPRSNLIATGAVSIEHVRRLWSRLRKVYRVQHLDEPCWEWAGARSNTGYGSIWIDGRTELTHKLAYYVFVGDIGDKHVCHKCDNRLCCNPSHHFLGTRSDNMKDAYEKGRLKNTFSTGDAGSQQKDREIKRQQILTMKERGWPDTQIAERMQMTVEQVQTLAKA